MKSKDKAQKRQLDNNSDNSDSSIIVSDDPNNQTEIVMENVRQAKGKNPSTSRRGRSKGKRPKDDPVLQVLDSLAKEFPLRQDDSDEDSLSILADPKELEERHQTEELPNIQKGHPMPQEAESSKKYGGLVFAPSRLKPTDTPATNQSQMLWLGLFRKQPPSNTLLGMIKEDRIKEIMSAYLLPDSWYSDMNFQEQWDFAKSAIIIPAITDLPSDNTKHTQRPEQYSIVKTTAINEILVKLTDLAVQTETNVKRLAGVQPIRPHVLPHISLITPTSMAGTSKSQQPVPIPTSTDPNTWICD